jgi:hypothetical protein
LESFETLLIFNVLLTSPMIQLSQRYPARILFGWVALLAASACATSADFASVPAASATTVTDIPATADAAVPDSAAAPKPPGSPLCVRTQSLCPGATGASCAAGLTSDAGSAADSGTTREAGPSDAQETCRLGPSQTAECSANGASKEGERCSQSLDCDTGLDCVRNGGNVEGQCRKYCCSGTCDSAAAPMTGPGTSFCDIQLTKEGGIKLPVCMPIRKCELLAKGACAKGETCGVVRDEDGTTGCVEEGPALVGQSCDEVHCGAGLTCLGRAGTRKCFRLCKDSVAPCPGTERCLWTAPTFNVQGTGVCVADASMKSR